MKIYNTTTGEVTDLTIIDRKTGCEWTHDLLGNTGSLHYNPEREMAELDQANIEWWQEIIAGLKHIDDLTEEAKYLLSNEDFEDLKERLYENGDGNDYERHIYVLTHILEEVISKHKSKPSDNTIEYDGGVFVAEEI